MTLTSKNVLQSIVNIIWTKPYKCFLGSLALLVFAPFMTLVGALLLADNKIPPFWNLFSIYVFSLVAVTIMLNLGDQNSSAKNAFWIWIVFSVAATLLAGFGYLEILFFKWISG
jgi:hypothetical protein